MADTVVKEYPLASEAPVNNAQEGELENQARRLAASHSLLDRARWQTQPEKALTNLLDVYQSLLEKANRVFRGATEQELAISSAAEWMLDNDYIVHKALQEIKEDLPLRYYRELPKLANGELEGYPRIYALARELILYDRAHLDPERAHRFLTAYQTVAPLTMGELWALPIMLRLGIIQGLIHSVCQVVGLPLPARKGRPMFIDLSPQIDNNEVVANSILSLRTLDTENWMDFFESTSLVERILRQDPAGQYAQMDFETRDAYRKALEELSLVSGADEQAVAVAVVDLSQAAFERNQPIGAGEIRPDSAARSTHVGYYLLDDGRSELEQSLGYQPLPLARLKHWLFSHPTPFYLGSIVSLSVVFLLAFILPAVYLEGRTWRWILTSILLLVPAFTLSVSLVNWLITRMVKPRVLPKMDYEEGLPEEHAALVVIPALLSGAKEIKFLLQQLEQHYLRNPDPHLFFALLTDFSDAPQPQMPEDEDLLEAARGGLEALNNSYPRKNGAPFYLFHRPRKWNPSEDRWIGWERKRGKLHELNRLILEERKVSRDTSEDQTTPGQQKASQVEKDHPDFIVQLGDTHLLGKFKYVITLDADTVLPRESAHRLVAAMAHPLNRPVFNSRGRVIAGYTVLQPRTEISPTSANRSRFTLIFAGNTGLDLYTRAVSDVYQDLFGEGIYVGKGIYDIEAFERSLEGRVPENALLSHDLFEGVHGRAALVTDIVLIEEYPPNYLTHAIRMSRWIRGDWQLLPWLLPRVPAEGRRIPNDLSVIDRWKIFDNLRRSLVPLSVFALFVTGWFGILPGSPWLWTLAGLLTSAAPFITGLFDALIHSLKTATTRGLRSAFEDNLQRWLLSLVLLPYEALLSFEAIFTTLVRLIITRRHLLRWTTSAQAALHLGEDISQKLTWRQMIFALGIVLLLGGLLFISNPVAMPAALAILIAWLFSPEIAYIISRPIQTKVTPLGEGSRQRLRILARQTWLFFEQYIGPEDHWLPPDHYQEAPLGIIAHRTSPTNIGLGLVSALAAYDFGYIEMLELVARLRSSLESIESLERYRGHLLNWYDTRSTEPLLPRYVSTVDSGNLAACLIVLKQGCQELTNVPALRWEMMQGLVDLLMLLDDLIKGLKTSQSQEAEMRSLLAGVFREIQAMQATPQAWTPWLVRFLGEDSLLARLEHSLMALVEAGAGELSGEDLRKLRIYSRRIRLHVENILRDIHILLPWNWLLSNPPSLFLLPGLDPALQEAWNNLGKALPVAYQLQDVDEVQAKGQAALERLKEMLLEKSSYLKELEVAHQSSYRQEADRWCEKFEETLRSAGMATRVLQIGLNEISRTAEKLVQEMDFRFLFDEHRQVFHIGYNVSSEKLDSNYYDLLASEARIASLVAIGKGDVPQSHWLHLARPITRVDGSQALLSWSATMFEYLMPLLFLRNYEGTLLSQTAQAAVDRQIEYGSEKGTPWGISESGYYRFDSNQVYQYRAFGVPGLGYKRGLGEDLVITPYASLLALPLRPQAVLKNIHDLSAMGMLGTLGFYEAVDYTPFRRRLASQPQIVQSYMAHHQGMIFLSIGNFILEERMVKRFHADPRIRSVDLLLQEQIPQDAHIERPHAEDARVVRPVQPRASAIPWRAQVQVAQPRVHYLSNGRYSLLINSAGGGYSAWEENGLTRWRSDTTLNDWGAWIYIKDLESGALWSPSHMPTATRPQSRDVYFNAHMVEFRRSDDNISTLMEITVHPEDDVEIRKITLTNHGRRTRRLFLASYGEVILTAQSADQRHPAFNKLFIESEWVPDASALLFRRRPRSDKEQPLFLAHALVVEQGSKTSPVFESDRARFIGRGRTVRSPLALSGRPDSARKGGKRSGFVEPRVNFSGTVGATLDPIYSIGQEIQLEPHESVQVAFLTLASGSRIQALALANRYQAWHAIQRAFDQARSQAEVELVQLGMTTAQVERIQTLLSMLLYPHAALRPEPARLAANSLGQSGLWAFNISGDYPILLACIHGQEDLTLARELLQAHAYWRNRHLPIDLVFLNEQGTTYGQELTGNLYRLIQATHSEEWLNHRGGIFLLLSDRLREEERILLETAARVVLDGKKGSLAGQLEGIGRLPSRLPQFVPSLQKKTDAEPTAFVRRPTDLGFDNGLGGFSADGREYVIYLEPGRCTPAPWVNVIANPEFGFLASESGSGSTWALNSGENRLTSWSNDPVSDPPGEAIYLRDEETAQVWSPTPLPARATAPYLVRHGAGYTTFEHSSHGLGQRLRLYAALDAPVKIVHLRLQNTWSRARRITVTYYAEWVLGVNRESNQPYIIPEFDAGSQALLARNPYNEEFRERVAFLATDQPVHGLTADRTEFLGRAGSRFKPAAIQRIGLAGTVHAGLDPCAALQVHVDLAPGKSQDVYFILGQAENRDQAVQLAMRFKDPQETQAAWRAVGEFWDDLLGTVCVHTPEPAMDLLLNRWLLYQTLACRIWGRTAFYQSSGAYGYRDQLQDVMALAIARPEITREHLLRAAAHQFEAGDVLHWWHPPSGRGVRTRFSDDLLWLPYVTAHYGGVTGDQSILDEKAPYRKGSPLEPNEEERYEKYASTGVNGSSGGGTAYSLYEHCLRALERGSTSGVHGLPLMGTGDWNDGMNRVGARGKGESIWLGWFLVDTLSRFAALCERKGDTGQADLYRRRAGDLAAALEANAWDGAWYLRAFYDDGTPLGSAQNRECQIDSIAQSWGVLSGAASPQRAAQAMQSVEGRLVRREEGLILLFTPPFDKTPRDPGYIKGYLPGIRENGGQYTHAALWAVWAFARLGQGDMAEELFQLLNPIYHADSSEKAARYRVEPYVVAADVYSVPPHTGRGGWTWYTGSSSWMYRLGVEAILGLRKEQDTLIVDPCIPKGWRGYEIVYRRGKTRCRIIVDNTQGVQRGVKQVILDGQPLPDGRIPLLQDGQEHQVRVVMG